MAGTESTPSGNGGARRCRDLALAEIEAQAKQLLQDSRDMRAGLEALLQECGEVRR